MLNLYADSVNKQFEKSSSHYVDFKTRLRQRINGETFLHSILENTTESFKEKNPHLKSWADLKLCRADSCALGDIRIDITMQRMVLFMWLIKILNEFEEIKLNPLRVFEDPDNPGKFVCWDGQHTGLALYVIATMVLGEDPDNCEIPINVYPIEHKAEARKNFMYANGEGSWDLDAIDFFQQMIFGVRTDGTKLPNWLVAEEKQQHLERAKMFATSDKFGDSDEPGAQPRMQELMDNSFSPTVTKHFCKYFTLICHSSRPVQPKESWMLYEYFRLCEADSHINVDNNYIQSVVRALRVVGGNDFDSLDFWHRAKTSYQNYYQQNVRHGLDLLGIRYPERPLAITFLIAQIRKAGVSVPNYRETYYEVPEGDLF